ncbi:MAG: T9SS type A sorting domain-containing protein [Chitinophagales bacterium]
MKKIFFGSFLLVSSCFSASAQTTWDRVYTVIQTNCAACHTAGSPSGLDLSGSSSEVYANLYDAGPENAISAAKGLKRVWPGDPYKSFLFTKINNELAIDVHLDTGEGEPCPQGGAMPLNDKDIELVRQWIMYGAQDNDTLVDVDMIADFYDNGGIQSVPEPPAPPAPGTGFQIHFGPYFLWPEDEHEYFFQYDPMLSNDIEINRYDTYMGDYSHHFITYRFITPGIAATLPYGLHDGPDFFGVDLVSANQYSDSLKLPQGTAFQWTAGTLLNLNSHYINYSPDKVLACEVYLNVYTQPFGTALQVMVPVLDSNGSFWVPNDGLPHTSEKAVFELGHGDDELFVWAMSSHTHKYGADFNIYKRNPDGTKGEQVFDAACLATNGAPGCLDEIYDYQHPPVRYWDEMLPVKWGEGVIYQTTWVNDGPESVGFGFTSDDEMSVMFFFFVDDTTGLNLQTTGVTDILPENDLLIYPNPAEDVVYIQTGAADLNDHAISLFDMTGKQVAYRGFGEMGYTNTAKIETGALPAGVYMLSLMNGDGSVVVKKVVIQ